MKNKPRAAAAAAASLPPAPLPLSRRGVHFAEKKENAIHTQELPREKKRGGENRGEEIGKAYFSSSLAVTPGPPCPCSRPRRAVLPSPSPAPSFPAPGGSGGGGRKTHSHSRTQLILNRLNQ